MQRRKDQRRCNVRAALEHWRTQLEIATLRHKASISLRHLLVLVADGWRRHQHPVVS
uniref:Uncharacterized protein n=1 Tax=Hyaloperonospora arabidopsidis (strain Emoy2) TaxID=559515 RepID=M4C6B3_HYAAE